MKLETERCSLLLFWLIGVIAAEYTENTNGGHGHNGNGLGNGNGHNGNGGNGNNGNAYGVPISPPPPSGPYPPSGWKPAGRRLILPGESRNGYREAVDTGYGQPPPSQYGPSAENPPPPQYGPAAGTPPPPDNQYIPGTGSSGSSGNGNGHNGNGHNGNGQTNNNGFNNGNGGNGGNKQNGNGLNGNGFVNGNGGSGLNGNDPANGNGNGGVTGNGRNNNGHSPGSGGAGRNGNGFANGQIPTFHSSFPNQGFGVVYPFVQLSVPATVAATRPGTGVAGDGIFPIFRFPATQSSDAGIFSALNSQSPLPVYPLVQATSHPSLQTSALHSAYSLAQLPYTSSHALGSDYPIVLTNSNLGASLTGNGFGHYSLLQNGLSYKANLIGAKQV